MKNNVLIILSVFLGLFSYKYNNKEITKSVNNIDNAFQFREIGTSKLLATKFPKQWKVRPYDEAPSIGLSDSLNTERLNSLDYFDNVKGKLSQNSKY